MRPASSPTARAVTLMETVVLLAIAALLAAMLAAATAGSRRHASLAQNFANLQQFAAGTTTYAADWEDRVWSFTDDSANPTQGLAIVRSQIDGRPDMAPLSSVYWPYYSHLVLLKHLDSRLFAPWIVSPEDGILRTAQRDPDGWPFDDTRPSTGFELFAYRSSYELGAAFTAPDSRLADGTTIADQHGLQHRRWNSTNIAFGNRFLHEISSPSQKAMVYEREQRHFGPRNVFFMHTEARVPVLTADGAASVRRTADANRGFRPNSPSILAPSLLAYQPDGLWEAPTIRGTASEVVAGHYRWTRGGLKGRDFDAGEIDTRDW